MPRDASVSHHILPTAAAMVGVCMTSISIIRLLEVSNSVVLLIDGIIATDSLIFLISAVLSYLSLRAAKPLTVQRLERFADLIFLLGLTLMVIIGFLLAYEVGVVEVERTH